MSELLVNTIKKADGTGSLSVPAESGTVVTTASPSLGRRNVLYNGAMAVAQRSASVTGVGNGVGYYTCDRWNILNGLTSAQFTVEQSSDAPVGFANSLKMTCTTAEATIDTSEYFFFRQRLEGYDLQGFKKGTSSAESMAVSFWIKSNKTGSIQVTFREEYNDRQIGQAVSISAANTWEYKTVIVPGDTTGTIPNSSNADFSLEFWVDAGANYSSGSVPTSWETYVGNSGNRGAGATLNISDATSNYIAITGVQLEVGSVATPFEHRSYGEELALCQRYYWRMDGRGFLAMASKYTTNQIYCGFGLPVSMRSQPTFDSASGTNYYRFYANSDNAYFNDWSGVQGAQEGSLDKIMIYDVATAHEIATNGQSGWVQLFDTNAYVALSAEL